mmetsp:Transcript_19688/g.32017  ORF Transcript_19688/g.32017 Transcript_19688/m.32017 type:complete len:84 (+) Transcript_19688:1598-1849(+)
MSIADRLPEALQFAAKHGRVTIKYHDDPWWSQNSEVSLRFGCTCYIHFASFYSSDFKEAAGRYPRPANCPKGTAEAFFCAEIR